MDVSINQASPKFENTFLRHRTHVALTTFREMFEYKPTVSVRREAPSRVVMNDSDVAMFAVRPKKLIVQS